MKFELARLAQYDNDSIIAELKRVAALVPAGQKFTSKFLDTHGKVSASSVRHRFGGWHRGLHAAGLSHLYSGRTVSDKMKTQRARYMTDEQLVAELQRVASKLGSDTLAQHEFNSESDISASSISRRLGSWSKALHGAGLRPVNMARRHTEDDYFENLLAVWTHFGRQPKYREMDSPPSVITSGAYGNCWGSWAEALAAFVERVNAAEVEASASSPEVPPPPVAAPSTPLKPEDQRKVPLGLRYNVLRRDSFKCVLCGNSPATDPSCKLHVDHIEPISKNGKTMQSNLRTLCADCNIGKSNKTEIFQQENVPLQSDRARSD